MPRSTEEFVRYFQESEHGRKNKESIRQYLEEYDMGEYVLPTSVAPSAANSSTSSARDSIAVEKERSKEDGRDGNIVVKAARTGRVLPSPSRSAAVRPSSGALAFAENYKHSARSEKAKHTRKAESYTISTWMQARLVMKRSVLILKGDWGAQVAQLL